MTKKTKQQPVKVDTTPTTPAKNTTPPVAFPRTMDELEAIETRAERMELLSLAARRFDDLTDRQAEVAHNLAIWELGNIEPIAGAFGLLVLAALKTCDVDAFRAASSAYFTLGGGDRLHFEDAIRCQRPAVHEILSYYEMDFATVEYYDTRAARRAAHGRIRAREEAKYRGGKRRG